MVVGWGEEFCVEVCDGGNGGGVTGAWGEDAGLGGVGRARDVRGEEGNPRGMYGGGGGCLVGSVSCNGEAVGYGVEWFGEDCC